MSEEGPLLPPLAALLEEAVREGGIPAIQAAAFARGALVHRSAHGRDHEGAPLTPAHLFDVASLTKAMVTAPAIALLAGEGALSLEDPVARHLPAFAAAGKGDLRVEELLAHRSGMPAWAPLFAEAMRDPTAAAIFPHAPPASSEEARVRAWARARAIVLDGVMGAAPAQPRGRRVYSDLGYIALGALIEALSGAPLDRLAEARLLRPLGLVRSRYFDLRRGPPGVGPLVATGRSRPRPPAPGQEGLFELPEGALRGPDPGQVDDDNAYALGGVAGHAGLFSTAEEVALLGLRLHEEMMGAGRLDPRAGPILAALAAPDPHPSAGPARALGFDRPDGPGSSAGPRLGQIGPLGAFGHLGFTGCALWVDRDRELSVALLSNRVYAGRERIEAIRALRPTFFERARSLLERA